MEDSKDIYEVAHIHADGATQRGERPRVPVGVTFSAVIHFSIRAGDAAGSAPFSIPPSFSAAIRNAGEGPEAWLVSSSSAAIIFPHRAHPWSKSGQCWAPYFHNLRPATPDFGCSCTTCILNECECLRMSRGSRSCYLYETPCFHIKSSSSHAILVFIDADAISIKEIIIL
eukprot:GHVU01107630.1.p1 GENE.GHVU01107630.1~~GHVU01107630.1.p1  ORF type:complete len:171 (-),score=4.24 GHVU01107630.1:674-1186(-)